MRFVPAVVAAILLAIVGYVADVSADATSNTSPKKAIFAANHYDVLAYPLGSTGDVTPIALTTDLAAPGGIARDAIGRLYVTNRASNSVTIFAANANGNVPPIAVIGGPHSRLSHPSGIAVGTDGMIYVANDMNPSKGGSITIYPPLAGTGILDEPPVSEISGSGTLLDEVTGIALDSHGNIYAANELGGPAVPHQRFDVGRITVYAAASSGNVAPVATISGANTGLASPTSIVLDAADNIYVLNAETANHGANPNLGSSITIYQAGSKGDAMPIATIAGDNTNLIPFGGIAVDVGGSVYTTGCSPSGALMGCTTVSTFAAGSNGNVSPATTIFNGGEPAGIAVDPSRNIYLLNSFGGTLADSEIVVYAAGSSGDALPIATIYDNISGFSRVSGVAIDSAGTIYAADPSGGIFHNGSINFYPAGSYAAGVAPSNAITGPDTELFSTSGVAIDSNGEIFALNYNYVNKYAPGSSGDAVPEAFFEVPAATPATGLAVNRSGKLYVTVNAAVRCHRRSCHEANSGKVLIWPAGSDGSKGPGSVISGSETGLANPSAIAVDDAGKIYVTNQGHLRCSAGDASCVPGGSASVTVYASAASGNAPPTATINGPRTGLVLPTGIALDQSGNIYVLDGGFFGGALGGGFGYTSAAVSTRHTAERTVISIGPSSVKTRPDRILIFPPGSSGDVAPSGSIGGGFTGLDFPTGIAIGPTGN